MENLSQICKLRREGSFGLKHQLFPNALHMAARWIQGLLLVTVAKWFLPIMLELLTDRLKARLYLASPGDAWVHLLVFLL